MKTSLHRIGLCSLLAIPALSGGCQAIWEDQALRPYENAMSHGRMSPGEYQRMRDQIQQAADGQPLPPPSRMPTK